MKMLQKRSVMIAVAVIALMTLTAGVAAAASMKAHKIDAAGGVGGVGLALGGTVDSKFKIKDGVIKSVKITTVDEGFGGLIDGVTNCEEKGKHSEDACDAVDDILIGAVVESSHTSKATLKVIAHDAVSIVGTLKGNLKADLKITGGNTEVLTGKANLKIKSVEGAPSVYQCLIGVDPIFTGTPLAPGPIFGDIQVCIDSPGPNALGLFVPPLGPYTPFAPFGGTYIDLLGVPIDGPAFGIGPVLVPVILHVVDTGKFKVESEVTEMKGKISVTVNSVGGVAVGPIFITKAKAEFGDEDED